MVPPIDTVNNNPQTSAAGGQDPNGKKTTRRTSDPNPIRRLLAKKKKLITGECVPIADALLADFNRIRDDINYINPKIDIGGIKTIDQAIDRADENAIDAIVAGKKPWEAARYTFDGVEFRRQTKKPEYYKNIEEAYGTLFHLILVTDIDENAKQDILDSRNAGAIGNAEVKIELAKIDEELKIVGKDEKDKIRARFSERFQKLDNFNKTRKKTGFEPTKKELEIYSRIPSSKDYPEVQAALAKITIADMVCKQISDEETSVLSADRTTAINEAIKYCESARAMLLFIANIIKQQGNKDEDETDYFHIKQSWLVQAKLKALLGKDKAPDADIKGILDDALLKDDEEKQKIEESFKNNRYISKDRAPDGITPKENRAISMNGIIYVTQAANVEYAKLTTQKEDVTDQEIDQKIKLCETAMVELKAQDKQTDYVYGSAEQTIKELKLKKERASDDYTGMEAAVSSFPDIKLSPYDDLRANQIVQQISIDLELGKMEEDVMRNVLRQLQAQKAIFSPSSYSYIYIEQLEAKLINEMTRPLQGEAANAVISNNIEKLGGEKGIIAKIGKLHLRDPQAQSSLSASAKCELGKAESILARGLDNETDKRKHLQMAMDDFKAAISDYGMDERTLADEISQKSNSVKRAFIWLLNEWAGCMLQMALLNDKKIGDPTFEKVGQNFELALKLCGKNKEALNRIQMNYAHALNEQGGHFASVGDVGKAEEKYSASIGKIHDVIIWLTHLPVVTAPDKKLINEARHAFADAKLGMSNVQLTLGKYAEALKTAKEGLDSLPALAREVQTMRGVSLFSLKEMEFKLKEVRIIAYLNLGEYINPKTGKYYYEEYIGQLDDELRSILRAPAASVNGDRNAFILLLQAHLIKACHGFGDVLALHGKNTKAQEQYGRAITTYNEIRGAWRNPPPVSLSLRKDQASVLQALLDAQANVISALTRIADHVRSLDSMEWADYVKGEAGNFIKSLNSKELNDLLRAGNLADARIVFEKIVYGLAGNVVSGDPADDIVFNALCQFFGRKVKNLTIQEKNNVFAEIKLARADANSRLPESRKIEYKNVINDIDSAEKLCKDAIDHGYKNNMALHIVRADAGVARAKVLNQIKNHDPKTVELYQVKDALGVKGGKPDDPSIPHTIEFAIGILEGFYKNNPDNLQVAIKLAQDYEAEGYALLNRVASLQNRVEAAKYFRSAEDIYNYKADGEHFSIPEQVRCLGLARVHKIQGSMNGSLEDGEGAIISYKQALNDLENVSDNNNEKKQLRSEINHELGGEHASLWQGEELGRKGELPERLRDDCPKAITYFGNSLKILGVRTTDSFSDIMSGLSVLPEEKQLFGCRVLIRMEMVKEMIAAEESDSEDKSAIYEATIANLGTLKDTINETRKKATQNGEQPFMPQEAIDALVRDINLNIGRLRLWNKEYDEAGEIFEKVIQDKDRLLDPEKGKDLFSVLPANPKADDIEKGAAEILKTVPDENNLAAIICLGESWKWRKENRDKDLAESLLGLAVSETVLSSEKLPIISYCPLYLQEEVKHALLKGVGEMKLVVAGSSNPGITDYHIGLESIPLPFELAGCAGYGSGEMDYVRTYDRYGNAVHSRDPYHYYYLEIGKYDGDRDRRFLTGGARFFSDPQNVSIQEYKLHGSFDLDLPAKYKLFGSKSPVKFFVEGIFSMAHIDDKDCFFNTIGRGNETSDPMNWMYQIGIQPYANKWFESAVTFIDQYYGYNDQYVGFNYPSLDKPELKSIGLQAKFVDEKFIGGPLTVTGGLSVPLKDTFPFLTDDLFESSASCELKYEHKYFDAALSVSNYVTGLQTKTTTVGFKAGFNESLLSLFLKPRKKSAIKASPAGSPQDQPKKDAGSAPVPKPVEVNINQLEPGKFEVKQAELPKKDDIFKAEEKIEIKLPTAYNNVRIAEEAEQPAQTSGKGVPAQKKAAPAGNDVGLKRSLFSLLKGPDPITVAENLDEKARASRAADQLMALLNKPILI